MNKITLALGSLLLAHTYMAHASPVLASWGEIEKSARGQTVYFNAWGGGEQINRYIDWAAQEVKKRYGVTVQHVKVNDANDYIQRIKTEVAAGRKQNGSVDLVWINGENFRTLKQANLLYGPWAEDVPNWRYVDKRKPVRNDFSLATDGMESPWGTAQLTFIADRRQTAKPPKSANEWLAFARANPGRTSYPKPPDFHGTTFLKQLLLELSPTPQALQMPVTAPLFDKVSAPLWHYLDQLHPLLWRQGKAFPGGIADMHRMLGDGELKLSMSFNPNDAANLIVSKQLPASVYSFGFTRGTIGNVHFVAIPANATAKAGAQVFANFLLSPEAQLRKADVRYWGDSSVLDARSLNSSQATALRKKSPGALPDGVPTLDEPHASWVNALEQAWLKRYGAR